MDAHARHDDMEVDDNSATKAIVDRVEDITRLIITAINTRDLDSIQPYHAKSFKTGPDYLTPSGGSLEVYLDSVKQLTKDYPEYQLTIADITTYVDQATAGALHSNIAKVWVEVDVTGQPVGVSWKGLSIVEFRCIRGKWLCVGWEGLRGRMQDFMSEVAAA